MKKFAYKNFFMIIKLLKKMLIIFFVLIIIFVINGSVEYLYVQDQIDEFVERGKFIQSIENYNFYEVEKYYDYENTNYYSYDINTHGKANEYIGDIGDIIITSRNPLKNVIIISNLTGLFSKYYYAGHASINSSIGGSKIIESDGKVYGVVREGVNDWMKITTCPTIIGLRVNTTDEVKQKAVDYCYDKLGNSYSYNFLFTSPNKFYCTDLISRAYKEANCGINYDYLATTGNDILLSKNTYLFFYLEQYEIDDETKYNVYYLVNNKGVQNE